MKKKRFLSTQQPNCESSEPATFGEDSPTTPSIIPAGHRPLKPRLYISRSLHLKLGHAQLGLKLASDLDVRGLGRHP
ncbi:hypothetical protein NL676_008343 [Syzygium grande]|nr:hypothetical protein NL676_008343 [Syzygium grande]